MPWNKSDATKHCKAANTDKKAEVWARVANETLERTKDDGKALAAAAIAVGNMKEEEIRRGRIQEARTSQSGKVEVLVEDNGKTTILKDVLIVGKTSRNKRDYTDDSLRMALPMYDGAEVFVGHTKDGSNPLFDRSMGVIRNPRLTAEGVRADHAFPSANRMAEDLIWRADHAPRGVGYSQDADTVGNYQTNGRVKVNEIERVYSVDLVTRPATTAGMREDEESIPDDQRDFAEHLFSALSDCRSIVTSDDTLAEKRSRLLEEIYAIHGEIMEGEIGDELAKEAPRRRIRELNGVAARKLDEAMWSSDKYPRHHDLKKRHIDVLADWSKELKAVQCNCPDCSSGKTQEEADMDFKELTIETLTKERPDLIAKLQGTDEHTRLTEEVKTLKASVATRDTEITTLKAVESGRVKEAEIAKELADAKFPIGDVKAFSSRFQEDLKKAKDKAERAEIINDRMALSGRIQESYGLPSPLAEIGTGTKQPAGANPAHDYLFGANK